MEDGKYEVHLIHQRIHSDHWIETPSTSLCVLAAYDLGGLSTCAADVVI